ncbi:energy-coupling factor transporter transmembrane component T [Atopobiaceae bacterium 24-176]
MAAAIGRYMAGTSFLHRADPRVKTVAVAMAMASTFLVTTPAQALLATAAFLALCASARLSPVRCLRTCLPVIAGLVLISCLNLFVTRTGATLWSFGPLSVTEGGARWAALYSVRLTLLVLTGSILLVTTTPTELAGAFSSLLSPLERVGVPVGSVALVLSLALRFVPTLGDELESVREAQEARGGSMAAGGVASRVRALTSVLVPALTGALRHAQGLSLALEARGFDPSRPRTSWKPPKVRGGDVAFALVCAAYLAALLAACLLG